MGVFEINGDAFSIIEAEWKNNALQKLVISEKFSINKDVKLIQKKIIGIECKVLLIPAKKVLFNIHKFPFSDPKKILQVSVPHFEDQLPFDLEDFTIDVLNLGDGRSLTGAIQDNELKDSLDTAQELRIDPLIISSSGGCISILSKFIKSPNLVCVLLGENAHLTYCFIKDSKALLLRERFYNDIGNEAILIKGEITRLMKTSNSELFELLILRSDVSDEIARGLVRLAPKITSIAEIIGFKGDTLNISNASLLGLIAHKNSTIINFRKGKFASKRKFEELKESFKNEWLYILLAAILGSIWFFNSLYSYYSQLNTLNDQISSQLSTVLPGEKFSKGNEILALSSKLGAVKKQLSDIGTSNSLTPLEAIQNFIQAVNSIPDLQIDSVEYSRASLIVNGSVKDQEALSAVSAALEAKSDIFTEVDLKSLAKLGNVRTKFKAELTLRN